MITDERKRKYLELRRYMSQTEARLLANVGRTTSWQWDHEAGLTKPSAEPVDQPANDQAPPEPPLDTLRDHIERDVESGVLPEGVADAFDDEPDGAPGSLPIASGLQISVPSKTMPGNDPRVVYLRGEAPIPGAVQIGVGAPRMRGSFGVPNEDGNGNAIVVPPNTSGRPGSAVRIRLRVRNPIPYGDDAGIGSWSDR